jgi:hypothetical protein
MVKKILKKFRLRQRACKRCERLYLGSKNSRICPDCCLPGGNFPKKEKILNLRNKDIDIRRLKNGRK